MTELKATPSPWTISTNVDGPEGNRTVYYTIDAADHEPVHHEWGILKEADAHLIRSSRELYDALTDLFHAAYDEGELSTELGQRVLATLSAARGETGTQP